MKISLLAALLVSLFLWGCKTTTGPSSPYITSLSFEPGQEDDIRRALIQANDSTEIKLAAGTYHFPKLSLKGKLQQIKLVGAGQENTILDFSKQQTGGEGLRIDYIDGLTIEGMTLRESTGDLLKFTECKNVLIADVGTIWQGEPDSANGGYGIYPVLCENVTIEHCYARGASDAGIYVGQTLGAIVRHCKAEYNVAGIEIENTQDAVVHDNESCHNTGGLLIFDLPGLKYDGKNTVAYDNHIHNNNYRNFARASNSVSGVGNVPPGTGIMILRTSDLKVTNNRIENNNTMSLGILSYLSVDPSILETMPTFDPIPRNVTVKGNEITKEDNFPEAAYTHHIAQTIIQLQDGLSKVGVSTIPEILFDGIVVGEGTNPTSLCIEQPGDSFINMDSGNNFAKPGFDVEPYACEVD